ncbi:MAG: leucine-rich repeat domain-containing protein [Planctomycetia bacterium]|nr:leucine-rich repeat domain-containing protein [Planctomycetia bacterium]
MTNLSFPIPSFPVLHLFFVALMVVGNLMAGEGLDYEYDKEEDYILITRYIGEEKHVRIPEKIEGLPVTSIRPRAFYRCDSVVSVELPEGITTLGFSVFDTCKHLTTVTFSQGLKQVDAGFFDACPELREIQIPPENTTFQFSDDVLLGDDGKTLIVCLPHKRGDYQIPAGVTTIGRFAFWKCQELTSVTIPEGVTSLGGVAFGSCRGLTSVILPDSLTSIEGNAFTDCQSLTEIVLPDGVTSLKSGLFSGCENLKSVTLPKGLKQMEGNPFQYCPRLEEVHIPSENTAFRWVDHVLFSGDGKKLIACLPLPRRKVYQIPAGVTAIGEGAFSTHKHLLKVEIPDSVTSIERKAFGFCENLQSLTIPESVISIGENAFVGCLNLTDIQLPEGLTSLRAHLFAGCKSLTAITIPEKVTCIDIGAFWGCTNLTEITLPDGLTFLEDSLFEGCEKLTSVNIPDSVTEIRSNAFSGCKSLTFLKIPPATSIDNRAFYECEHLTLGVWEDSEAEAFAKLEEMPHQVFRKFHYEKHADHIVITRYVGPETHVVIPAMIEDLPVTTLKEGALEGCKEVVSLEFSDYMTSIDKNALTGCQLTIHASEGTPAEKFAQENGIPFQQLIPFEYEKYKDHIFIIRYLGQDANVVIPAFLEGLPVAFLSGEVFHECHHLTSVTIPARVIGIAGNPFVHCRRLQTIHIDTKNTSFQQIGKGLFSHDGEMIACLPCHQGSYEVPDGIYTIFHEAFRGCAGLTDVTIPDSVQYIGEDAFEGCEKLTIHASKGSVAEKYAQEKKIPFQAIP